VLKDYVPTTRSTSAAIAAANVGIAVPPFDIRVSLKLCCCLLVTLLFATPPQFPQHSAPRGSHSPSNSDEIAILCVVAGRRVVNG